jgi:hypothetical protein
MASLVIAHDPDTGLRVQWDKPNDYGQPPPFAVYDASGAQVGRRRADRRAALRAFSDAVRRRRVAAAPDG